MADTSGMAEIRGIDIQKLAVAYEEEDRLFKRFVTIAPTSAREIRWYQKTSGILEATSPAVIHNVAELALPNVLEQSVTRETSYVRKYFVESPVISDEDIKDADPDILGMNVHELTMAIEYQVDKRIWDVLTESRIVVNINSITCSGSGWDTGAVAGDPIDDILSAKYELRIDHINPEGATLFLNAIGQKNLIQYLISTKGSSIPQFASEKVESGVVMRILGCNVVVSENVTSDYGCLAQGKLACKWKTFVPITARTIDEVGIGTKIRVWEEGEAILERPKAVCLISGSGTV